jgi:hypothetical protein
MTLEASLYGSDNQRGANWHPTRAFHMLRGEAIAWIYALILLETVQMVHGALAAGSTKQLLLQGNPRLKSSSSLMLSLMTSLDCRLSFEAR